MAIKIAVWLPVKDLCTLSSDSSGQLDVFGHNGDPLGMDGAEIGVFEEADQVSLGGFLQGSDRCTLETQVGLEILGDFTYQSLEGQLSDEQFSGFLVSSDFTKSNGTRSVTMGFLHSTGGRCALSGGFRGQLFSWSFTSGRFSCSLLGSCHLEEEFVEIRLVSYLSVLYKLKTASSLINFIYRALRKKLQSDWLIM